MDHGQKLAAVRLEQHRLFADRTGIETRCPRLVPGTTFNLTDHPEADCNRRHLTVAVTHYGSQPQSLESRAPADSGFTYANTVTVVPADVPARPLPAPERVTRFQNAAITGPAGEEIHTDAHGRSIVQFPWDRRGKHNPSAAPNGCAPTRPGPAPAGAPCSCRASARKCSWISSKATRTAR